MLLGILEKGKRGFGGKCILGDILLWCEGISRLAGNG
jgi:hypothetical protein